MMNTTDIVLLMEEASKRLETHDPIFSDKTETVLAILRSKGVISSKRLQQNGKYHTHPSCFSCTRTRKELRPLPHHTKPR